MKSVGTIEVWVYRTGYGKRGGDDTGTDEGFMDSDGEEVAEAALKGMAKSHGTTYCLSFHIPPIPSY
jgi:hypothetical protein